MRKLILVVLPFVLFHIPSFAQFFVGIKIGSDFGFEFGYEILERYSVKAYTFTDYSSTRRIIYGNKTEIDDGNRYCLSYGIGAGMRIAGPFWLNLDAGYGWGGKHTIDPVYETRARKDNVQGFEVGVEAQWNFSNGFYLSGGYLAVPAGFSKGRPMNCIMVTGGGRF